MAGRVVGHGLLFALMLCLTGSAVGLELRLHAEDLVMGDWRASMLTAKLDPEPVIRIEGILHAGGLEIGSVHLQCDPGSSIDALECDTGMFEWRQPDSRRLEFSLARRSGGWLISRDQVQAEVMPGEDGALRISMRRFALSWLPLAWLHSPVELTGIHGGLDLDGRIDADRAELRATLAGAGFDTTSGVYAGDGIGLNIELEWRSDPGRFELQGDWHAGELLFGALYLPPPSDPWRFEGRAQTEEAAWRLDQLGLEREGALALNGTGRMLTTATAGWELEYLQLQLSDLDIAWLWRQGLQSLAAARGWDGLQPAGRAQARVELLGRSLSVLDLRLERVSMSDRFERLGLDGFQSRLEWRASPGERAPGKLDFSAAWDNAALLALPLGASRLSASSNGDRNIRLEQPLELPLLDGRLVVEQFDWRDWGGPDSDLRLSARLEPVDLSRLTRTLGWTEFVGTLAGHFPALRLGGGVFEFEGGLDVSLFEGSARVENFSIERPFGTLPALAADIEFTALNLEQLTGAFEFGHMTGLLSGHIRQLRLLDWQPVQFDAWFETHENVRGRRISQQAIDSLSSLGGGGGAMLSGTLLRVFEDFPYRSVGLGCRLHNNVCTMRGLESAEGGGYTILEGRGLPRLDIIGHRRSVDWPRLMAQLKAATASGSNNN